MQAAHDTRSRGLRARKNGQTAAVVTAYVDPALATELGVRAVREHRTRSELVASALAAYLEQPGRP